MYCPRTKACIALSSTLLFGLLSACATTSNISDSDSIPAEKGIMVLRTTTTEELQLQWVDYADDLTFGSSMSDYFGGPQGSLMAAGGTRVWVLTVDQGDYMWGDV